MKVKFHHDFDEKDISEIKVWAWLDLKDKKLADYKEWKFINLKFGNLKVFPSWCNFYIWISDFHIQIKDIDFYLDDSGYIYTFYYNAKIYVAKSLSEFLSRIEFVLLQL